MARRTTLVVAHSPAEMEALSGILAAEGYGTRAFDNGERALAWVAAHPVELILLDLRTPGMGGSEFCRRLQGDAEARRIPVILIGEAGDLEQQAEGLRNGAVDVLTRPVQREELLVRVRIRLAAGRPRAALEGREAERIRESETYFRSLADAAPVGIWLADRGGAITYSNKRLIAYSGMEPDQLVGGGWMNYVHPEDLPRVMPAISSAIGGQSRFELEFRMRRADGQYRWVAVTAVPRYDSGGYAGYAGTTVDITDLERSRQRALATEKLESLGAQAAGIVHDLGNMVASILAQSEFAASVCDDCRRTGRREGDATAQRLITGITADAGRASRIVDSLLTYAEGGAPATELVDLSSLIDETIGSLRVLTTKKATLRTRLARDLPPVRVNAGRIYQVVMNLVTNASDALEDGGTITIATERVPANEGPSGDDSVRLVVSDTGCGMTEEVRARVFQPFYTTKSTGRGLGLMSVQAVLREIGGEISVKSAPGQGSTFEVLLPGCEGVGERTATPAGSAISRD